ncbi:MAG: DUF4003 domain-containing protein [Lachnospiraceae bacterium]|nr:DUF4003 domain-containing protein [Lachnospiraceae bacterium]
MNEQIKVKCDHFTENTNEVKKVFRLSNNMIMIATALIYGDKDVDADKLEACSKYIAKNTSYFSSFQSRSKSIVASKMAIQDEPEKYFDDVKKVYDIITKGSIFDSAYLIEAAMIIVDAGKVAEAEAIVNKFSDLYKRMNKEHPFLTSTDDIAFGYLLCLTEKSVDQIMEEMEWAYDYLNSEVQIKLGKNEIQGIAEVLTMTDGDMKAKCDKVVEIYNKFLDKDVKYGNEKNESSMLGVLIDVGIDTETLVNEIIEVADYIKDSKGFGGLALSNKQRLLFASSLVADSYNNSNKAAAVGTVSSVISTVISNQIVLMMVVFFA